MQRFFENVGINGEADEKTGIAMDKLWLLRYNFHKPEERNNENNIMISTTTDPGIAANFGDTLFVIYASREPWEEEPATVYRSYVKVELLAP